MITQRTCSDCQIPLSRNPTATRCHSCAAKLREQGKSIATSCAECHKLISRPQSQILESGRAFCDMDCSAAYRKRPGMYAGSNFGRRGPQAGGWRGGRTLTKDGYVVLCLNGLSEHEQQLFSPMQNRNGCIREHRLVYARYLGRPLMKEEKVHHLNGVKDDNRLENLELTNNSQHRRDHISCERDRLSLRKTNTQLLSAAVFYGLALDMFLKG